MVPFLYMHMKMFQPWRSSSVTKHFVTAKDLCCQNVSQSALSNSCNGLLHVLLKSCLPLLVSDTSLSLAVPVINDDFTTFPTSQSTSIPTVSRREREEVTFLCLVDGVPTPTVQWERTVGNEVIFVTPTTRIRINEVGVLRILNVSRPCSFDEACLSDMFGYFVLCSCNQVMKGYTPVMHKIPGAVPSKATNSSF